MARELLREILEFQVANLDRQDWEFYRCYTYDTGQMPDWVQKAKDLLEQPEVSTLSLKEGNLVKAMSEELNMPTESLVLQSLADELFIRTELAKGKVFYTLDSNGKLMEVQFK